MSATSNEFLIEDLQYHLLRVKNATKNITLSRAFTQRFVNERNFAPNPDQYKERKQLPAEVQDTLAAQRRRMEQVSQRSSKPLCVPRDEGLLNRASMCFRGSGDNPIASPDCQQAHESMINLFEQFGLEPELQEKCNVLYNMRFGEDCGQYTLWENGKRCVHSPIIPRTWRARVPLRVTTNPDPLLPVADMFNVPGGDVYPFTARARAGLAPRYTLLSTSEIVQNLAKGYVTQLARSVGDYNPKGKAEVRLRQDGTCVRNTEASGCSPTDVFKEVRIMDGLLCWQVDASVRPTVCWTVRPTDGPSDRANKNI